MPRKKPPLLVRGGLSGRVFIVTRYTQDAEGRTVALEKFEVTEDFNLLAAEIPPVTTDEGETPCVSCHRVGVHALNCPNRSVPVEGEE